METVDIKPAALVGPGHDSLNSHVVDHLLYTVNVTHEFSGQVLSSCVLGFAHQRYHAFFRLNSGVESAG